MTNGSLHNLLAGTNPNTSPFVGQGATEICWSDRHAYTVVEVLGPKTIVVQADKATRKDKNGMSESQDYTFERNPDGAKVVVTLRKNGQWVLKGDSIKGTKFALGYRSEYHDYSF